MYACVLLLFYTWILILPVCVCMQNSERVDGGTGIGREVYYNYMCTHTL